MSQRQIDNMQFFSDTVTPCRPCIQTRKQVEQLHPTPRQEVWRDVDEMREPELTESPEVTAFIEAHDLREVVKAMRSRALDIFHDVGELYLELDDERLWLHLESFGEARVVRAQDKEFLAWFVGSFSPEITAYVQLIVDFVKR